MTLEPTAKVWRYISFAKFFWMLQLKKLWLSNAMFFEDKWEAMPDPSLIKSSTEDALHRLQRFLTNNRRLTFVSCWNASEHESHALWRIYCPTSEGVAIQTTFACLEKSVAPLDVLEVTYNPHELDNILNPYKLATQKRPMFAYEQEVRVVLHQNLPTPNTQIVLRMALEYLGI